jgi:hypothetical protein
LRPEVFDHDAVGAQDEDVAIAIDLEVDTELQRTLICAIEVWVGDARI